MNSKILLADESLGLVCLPDQFLWNGSCVQECPGRHFASNHSSLTPRDGTPACLACHPSCARCSGSEPGECLACEPGHSLTGAGTCVLNPKAAWWLEIKIGVFVIIACLLLLPVVVCVLIQVRSCQTKRHLSKRYPTFIVNHRSDSHIAIEVSIDKPLLDVSSSDSDSEVNVRETVNRH